MFSVIKKINRTAVFLCFVLAAMLLASCAGRTEGQPSSDISGQHVSRPVEEAAQEPSAVPGQVYEGFSAAQGHVDEGSSAAPGPGDEGSPTTSDQRIEGVSETAGDGQTGSYGDTIDSWIKDHHIFREAEYVDISGTDVTGIDMDLVIEKLPNLKRLVMTGCGLDNDGYAALQDRHPDIKIVWDIILSHWTIPTDAVAFSTYKTTDQEFYMYNEEAYYLKYCTELVALDLGHNYVSDLSFLEHMPDLKILILVDNVRLKTEDERLYHLTDLSELRFCPKLRYLEFFANNVSDLSFLQYLPELEDLNISYNSVSSITYLTGLPRLQRLWMEGTYIPYESYVYLTGIYPNAEIVYFGEGSVDQGWRSGAHYYAMRRMFRENIIDPIYRD